MKGRRDPERGVDSLGSEIQGLRLWRSCSVGPRAGPDQAWGGDQGYQVGVTEWYPLNASCRPSGHGRKGICKLED